MKALVTGGAGFIGYHLCQALLVLGNKVAVVDDFSNEVSKIRLNSFTEGSLCDIVNGDVRDSELMSDLMNGVDVVYHLAALNSVTRSLQMPMKVHDVNTRGTVSVLLAARDNGVRRVVFASSSSVYGDMVVARSEGMLCDPVSPYGASKLAGETYCSAFNQSFGLSTISLRYFNIYGEMQPCNSEYAAVVPRSIKALVSGDRPVVYGSGEQVRSFTFIDDAVQGTILAGRSNLTGAFNIGSGAGNSVNALLGILYGIIVGSAAANPKYEPPRRGDVAFSVASIEKAEQLGYKPEWSLEDGLRRLVRNWEEL